MNNTSKEERLFTAAQDGDLKEVKALLAEGANLEWKEVSEIHIISELYIISNNTILVLLLMMILYVITVYAC